MVSSLIANDRKHELHLSKLSDLDKELQVGALSKNEKEKKYK